MGRFSLIGVNESVPQPVVGRNVERPELDEEVIEG